MKTISVWHDGEKREIELPELKGDMIEGQKTYHARRIADRVLDICERRGYGLGECGYYFNEEYIELMEFGMATPSEAREIRDKAEELAEMAQDNGMKIDHQYNSFLEEARRIQK